MAKTKSRKRSPSGLLSEAAKKAGRGVAVAAKRAVGKKTRGKSATGLLTEAARKAGRGISDAARKTVGMRPSRIKKSGSR
jgi:hypothetical protein